jgi:hypothetical protein
MMRIVFIICETMSINICEERIHDFYPATPIACIFAAGPELAQITPEGWGVDAWCCGEAAGETSDLVQFAECRNGPR